MNKGKEKGRIHTEVRVDAKRQNVLRIVADLGFYTAMLDFGL